MNERANDYVKDWLGAYLDGELSAERRAWVENHLATCAACQKELAELRALSNLLQSDPTPVPVVSAEVFTRQVLKRLPEPVLSLRLRALRTGLRYGPLGLFGIWAFSQAVIWVSALLLTSLSLFPQLAGLLSPLALNNGSLGSWLGGWITLPAMDNLAIEIAQFGWLGPLALINLSLVALLAVLFLAWLAGLWSYRRTLAEG